jgi:hypothetical protein
MEACVGAHHLSRKRKGMMPGRSAAAIAAISICRSSRGPSVDPHHESAVKSNCFRRVGFIKLLPFAKLFRTDCFIPRFDLGLLVQSHVQQGFMDFEFSVVFDKTQLAEFVRREIRLAGSFALVWFAMDGFWFISTLNHWFGL